MKSLRKFPVLILCAVSVLVPSANASLLAHLTLQGDPGDWVTHGGTFDIVYPTAEIWDDSFESASGYWAIEFYLGPFGRIDPTGAALNFVTNQPGVGIQPGVYAEAERAFVGQPGHPGLDVSFQQRGCNWLAGEFTVTNSSFYEGKIGSFSATFEQRCDGPTALHGTFSFVDTSAPSAVPEPGTMVLVCTAGWVPALRRRRARRGRVTSA